MVFFSCNACGTAVKKNQVDKHVSQCRNCEAVSCIDCGKDFWGNEYQLHTKCISEEEKYSGKDFKDKPNANKREKLLEQWSHHVREYLDATPVEKNLRQLLELLLNQDNIPKKEKKFRNFLLTGFKISSEHLIQSAWKIFSDAIKASQEPPKSKQQKNESADSLSNQSSNAKDEICDGEKSQHKQKHKKHKKDKAETQAAESMVVDDAVTPVAEPKSDKKKNKRNRDTFEDETVIPSPSKAPRMDKTVVNDEQQDDVQTNGKKKKKKKNRKVPEEEADEVSLPSKMQLDETLGNDIQDENVQLKGKKKKNKKDLLASEEKMENGLYGDDVSSWDNSKSINGAEDGLSAKKEKKSKKHKHEAENDSTVMEAKEENGGDENAEKKHKFKWNKVMEELVVQSPDGKIKLKKLKKRVLDQYKTSPDEDLSKAAIKFDNKLNNNAKLKIDGKTVILV